MLYTSYETKMSVKALFAKSCIVSSKGKVVNKEDTSYFFPNNWFNTTYDLNLTKTDLVDLLSVATKGQLFQYGQTDGVVMGFPLRPLLANVFMSHIEEDLEREDYI